MIHIGRWFSYQQLKLLNSRHCTVCHPCHCYSLLHSLAIYFVLLLGHSIKSSNNFNQERLSIFLSCYLALCQLNFSDWRWEIEVFYWVTHGGSFKCFNLMIRVKVIRVKANLSQQASDKKLNSRHETRLRFLFQMKKKTDWDKDDKWMLRCKTCRVVKQKMLLGASNQKE